MGMEPIAGNPLISGSVLSGHIASGQIGLNHIASGAIRSGHIASGQVGPNHLGSGVVLSGHIASGQVGPNHLSSGAVTSGRIASGQIGTHHLGSGSVVSGRVASGQIHQFSISSGAVNSGHIGNAAVVSGSIASGSLGTVHLADGAVTSGDISSGSVGRMHLASGAVNSGHLENGSVNSGNISSGVIGTLHLGDGAVTSGNIASGQVSTPHLAANAVGVVQIQGGSVIAGKIGSGAVVSGNIASGQVGQFHISSGAVSSGRLAAAGTPDGSKFLRDDFTWGTPTAAGVTSGGIQSGMIASGTIQGFYGATRHIASGTVGVFDLGSGAVTAGAVGSGAIVSGNIASGQIGNNHLGSGAVLSGHVASGQIGLNHIASGAVRSGHLASGQVGLNHIASGAVRSGHIASGQIGVNHLASGVITAGGPTGPTRISQTFQAYELLSGLWPLVLVSGPGVRIARADVSGLMPAIGINEGDALSGANVTVVQRGAVSGFLQVDSCYPGELLYVATSGVSAYGFIRDPGVLSGCWVQSMGICTEGGLNLPVLDVNPMVVGSGNIRDFQIAPDSITTSHITSGAVGSGRLAVTGLPLGTKFLRDDFTWEVPPINSGDVQSGEVASGAIQGFFGTTRHIASGTVGGFDLGSGAVTAGTVGSGAVRSGNLASGQIGQFHHASGSVTSGHVGNAAVLSGSIASGNVGQMHIASGAVTSGRLGVAGTPTGTTFLRDDFNWASVPITLTSGHVQSGHVASGAIQGFFGATRQIASGTVGSFDLGSGAITAGSVGSGAVLSGNLASGQVGINHLASGSVRSGAVASGQIGQFHIASGSVTSGRLGATGTPDGTKFLRDDFAWTALPDQLVSGSVTSGDVGNAAVVSGSIASGSIGSVHIADAAIGSSDIASGQIGQSHLAAGAVGNVQLLSGIVDSTKLGNGAVLSGHIASGQVADEHFASGGPFSRVITNRFRAAEHISGAYNVVTADSWGIASGGNDHQGLTAWAHIYKAGATSWNPAVGVVIDTVNSGDFVTVYQRGPVRISGNILGGPGGQLVGGQSGQLVGGVAFPGFPITASNQLVQIVGSMLSKTSGSVNTWVDVNPMNDYSGSVTRHHLGATGTPDGTKFLRDDFSWQTPSATVASGSITSDKLGSGAVSSGHLASGLVAPYSKGCLTEVCIAGEMISGSQAMPVAFMTISGGGLTKWSGGIVRSILGNSGRMPAFGVIVDNVDSGQPVTVYTHGMVTRSGRFFAWSPGVAMYPNVLGNLVARASIGAATSGQLIQPVGYSLTDDTFFVNPTNVPPGNGGNSYNSFGHGDWITAGMLAAGVVTASTIASGPTITSFMIASGAIQSGDLDTNFGAKPVLTANITSGARISFSELVADPGGGGTYRAAETLSGPLPIPVVVCNRSGQSLPLLLTARAASSGRMPAFGLITQTMLSGEAIIANGSGTPGIVMMGRISMASGILISGDAQTRNGASVPIFVGLSGELTASGPNLSGSMIQALGLLVHDAEGIAGQELMVGYRPASGEITWVRMASGAVRSGHLGVTGTPNGTRFLRDDFSWQSPSIASGSVGPFQLASGTVNSGHIADNAVVSGSIGSGQIGTNHISSGSFITFARADADDTITAAETISGVRCVQITGSGFARIAMASVSGRMPAVGVAFTNTLSGSPVTVVYAGKMLGPSSEIGSGLCISGRNQSRLWVGVSGQVVTISGGGPTIGIGATNSGAWGQMVGQVAGSGAVWISMGETLFSGASVITTNPAFWPL